MERYSPSDIESAIVSCTFHHSYRCGLPPGHLRFNYSRTNPSLPAIHTALCRL